MPSGKGRRQTSFNRIRIIKIFGPVASSKVVLGLTDSLLRPCVSFETRRMA
jgi:hypothetical protein